MNHHSYLRKMDDPQLEKASSGIYVLIRNMSFIVLTSSQLCPSRRTPPLL